MTPLMLQVLINAHISTDWIGTEGLRSGNATWLEQTEILFSAGMIESYPKNRADDFPYRTTPKGKFWLEYILSVPFPEPKQTWEIPNVSS